MARLGRLWLVWRFQEIYLGTILWKKLLQSWSSSGSQNRPNMKLRDCISLVFWTCVGTWDQIPSSYISYLTNALFIYKNGMLISFELVVVFWLFMCASAPISGQLALFSCKWVIWLCSVTRLAGFDSGQTNHSWVDVISTSSLSTWIASSVPRILLPNEKIEERRYILAWNSTCLYFIMSQTLPSSTIFCYLLWSFLDRFVTVSMLQQLLMSLRFCYQSIYDTGFGRLLSKSSKYSLWRFSLINRKLVKWTRGRNSIVAGFHSGHAHKAI